MKYFDYAPVAREAGIPDQRLTELCRRMRGEFPSDDMLYELHVLRTCMSVRDGLVTLEQVLQAESSVVT